MTKLIVAISALVHIGCSSTTVSPQPDTALVDTQAGLDGQTVDTAVPTDTVTASDTAIEPDTKPLGCHEAGAIPCDDGDLCNGEEVCDPTTGACIAGTPPEIDDSIACTLDTCDPKTGVIHTPDDSLCSTDGLCMSGFCDVTQGCQEKVTPDCCGNGDVEAGETCDDGNQEAGDGCSPKCELVTVCETGCTDTSECAEGLKCVGWPKKITDAFGKCVDMTAKPGENAPCSLTEPCAEGLACLGAYLPDIYDKPWCVQGWMANTFVSAKQLPIPDGNETGAYSEIVACGLASVPVDVVVTLHIDHPNPAELKVILHDPQSSPDEPGGGATDVLWNLEPEGATTIVAKIPGDDAVNGTWKLQVKDLVEGNTGSLKGWSIYLLSRWD